MAENGNDVLRTLVEKCESMGMRDDPAVMAARATLPKPVAPVSDASGAGSGPATAPKAK